MAGRKRVFGTRDPAISAPLPSDITAYKSAMRRKQQKKEREAEKQRQARETRLIQLAKMPGGRGAKEYKRLAEGGSMTESAAEKSARQRKAQLAAMPGGRGKVEHDKIIKEAERQAAAEAAKQKSAATATPAKPAKSGKEMVKNPYASANKDKEAKMKKLSKSFGSR